MPNNQQSGFFTGAGGAVLGMLGGAIGAGSQHRRQRELMELQQQHQMALNRQGHQLQHELWKKTSYPAQLAMMKKAGLSPGLMYGGGAGAGGSTGSQGGGSAAGGSAAAFNPMDMSNMMLMDAQRRKMDEEIEYSKWQRGEKGTAEIGALDAKARRDIADAVLNELDGKAREEYKDKYIQGLVAQWEQHGQDRDLKAILLGLKRNGMHTPYIATVIGTLSGWDMTEKGVFDKPVGVLPEGIRNTLSKVGIDINPQITRRQAMNVIISGIAAGKIGLDVFKTMFNPKRISESLTTVIKP